MERCSRPLPAESWPPSAATESSSALPATTPFCANCGAAFLYHTNGTLLVTFSPEFPSQQGFASAVAAVGNAPLIGAPTFDFAYLFDTAYTPEYKYATSPDHHPERHHGFDQLITAETGLILQQSDSVDDLAVWDDVPSRRPQWPHQHGSANIGKHQPLLYRLRQP